MFLGDKVDARLGSFSVEVCFKAFKCLQVDEATISVVGGKIKTRQEVGADDGLLYVCDEKVKIEYLVT